MVGAQREVLRTMPAGGALELPLPTGPLVGDRVQLVEASVPEEQPDGVFDLVVVCEVGYFLEPARFDTLADELRNRLAAAGLRELVRHREKEFVLQVWRRGT